MNWRWKRRNATSSGETAMSVPALITAQSTPDSGAPPPTAVPGLVAYAKSHFELAQAALRAGDFARYGEEIARVDDALQRLDELSPGLGLPSPGASASPAP